MFYMLNTTTPEDQKFYVTATRILDADLIGNVEYFNEGSCQNGNAYEGEGTRPEIRKRSEVHFDFKDSQKKSIVLFGADADRAWTNFRRVAGPLAARLTQHGEIEFFQEP